MTVDLESVSPVGRLDVLVYRGAEYFAKQLEAQYGLSGIWNNLQPHVNQAIGGALVGVEIPTELKVADLVLNFNTKSNFIHTK